MAQRNTFGGPGMDDPLVPQAAIDNPALGADPTLVAPPAGPAQIAPRQAGLTDMAAAQPINDDELLTEEEQRDRLAQILGLDPTELGKPYEHDENLAANMSENQLNTLGQELLEKIEADDQSRQPWMQRFKRGLEILGLKDFAWDKDAAPFDGASTAILPLLSEAVMQSQARFMEEIYPSAGPAKTMVMGKETPEKRDSADRVAAHMNYQLTKEDTVYFMESQKLALYLPIFGCGYRKGYHDYVEDRNVLRFITADDMILPYNARNLQASPRKTHRFKVSQDDYKASVAAGAWIQAELGEPPEAAPDQVREELDRVDDKTPVEADKDQEWTFYETDLRLVLTGEEDRDEAGRPTGVALPYTVTLEKETGKVVAIRRCWKENDPLKKMRDRYTEYWYFPGLGSYGTGLIHWIGTIAEAGTDALRALLDSATMATIQGGFKAKDAGTKSGEIRLRPGVWQDVDMTSDELDKAFHTPPVKEPSEALFKLLGLLIDVGRRFASITDTMVGEQDAKGAPVGTTIALIEQGSKVYSGVHKRAHFACGIELGIQYDLNAEHVPEEGYPYQVPGDDLAVYKADYDAKQVCVVPVSDPNIFSQTQRIALAQTRYQISQENPSYFKKFEVLKSLFKAFKDPDTDTFLVDPDQVPVMDPVTENVAIVQGRPVKAKDGENHDAHMIVHMSFAQHPQFGGLPQAQQLIGPQMLAHIAEHVALKYVETQRRLGVQVPPINLMAPPGTSPAGDEQPQQADVIAMAAAQMVQQFMQQSGLTTTPPGQENQAAAQEAEDRHELTKAQTWSAIAAALANMAKAGLTLDQAEQAEQAMLAMPPAGGAPAAGAAPAPVGAFGSAPARSQAPPRASAPHRPAMPAPRPAAALPPDQAKGADGKAPGMGPALHDENLDGAPVHAAAQPQNQPKQ